MAEFIDTNGHTQSLVHLRVKPHSHRSMPTITGNAFSRQAGAVLYGHYNMEYLLPKGDRIRLIANHNKKTVQLMLFTQDSQLIKSLPGERNSSLVADTISRIERYCIRAKSYAQPLTNEQNAKVRIANHGIMRLKELLEKERLLSAHDHEGHEALRAKVISIIERCRDNNRLLANNPVISEGSFGRILYDAHKAAHQFKFNRVFAVSTQDQMDFSSTNHASSTNAAPCFVWDSELHIGHNSDDLDDAIRVICNHYELLPAEELSKIPANRFKKVEVFFQHVWRDGRDWINYLATPINPTHKTDTSSRSDGISITTIAPYYRLSGFDQKGYNSVKSMLATLTDIETLPFYAQNLEDARNQLTNAHDGNWVYIAKKATVLYKQHGKLLELRYFKKDKLFFPLPIGDDLHTLSQVSKRHLYLPERVRLRLFAFVSRIPSFFKNFYISMRQFIVHDLHQEFMTHVHKNHHQSQTQEQSKSEDHDKISTLHKVLQQNGRLSNGQTLEEFILEHIENSSYVIARANHPPSPPAYEKSLSSIIGCLCVMFRDFLWILTNVIRLLARLQLRLIFTARVLY